MHPTRSDAVSALDRAAWTAVARAHAQRADALTATWRERHATGRPHAVEDFLFTYYPTKPGRLRRWNPGVGVVLTDATTPRDDDPAALTAPDATWRWYTTTDDGGLALDVPAYLADRGDTVRYVRALLAATASRPAFTGCFGLHEWAMVYRDAASGRDHRHPLPLRLGAAGTDDVVASHPVRCSHIDAFRFFTPEAVPLNRLQPTRELQPALEQPGCLHATMDLYKWALKLGPAVPGDLLLDCFELARDVRYTDMQASPYDVSSYGLDPVPIETPQGKTEYVRRQRAFAARGAALRARLLDVVGRLQPDAAPEA